ncbi:MAG: Gfo/Idh/MocA family oxidoreductase [Planctomycetota bacterium]
MTCTKLRTAIIGTGDIAKRHLDAIRNNPEDYELVAACDTNEENAQRFKALTGLERCYSSAEELLAKEELNLVQISTPPGSHVPLSIMAMEAGVNVLCEKPLCGSLADLDRVNEAERRTGQWCASVFQFRYGATTQHLKRLMKEGRLGRPLVAACHTVWYRNLEYFAVPWRGKWETELGGPTVIHGIHAMDHLLCLLGEWSEVRADCGTLDRPTEAEDVSMAIVRFANGAMASIINSVISPRQETYLRLDYQQATAELRHLYEYTNEDWTFTPTPEAPDDLSKALADIGESNLSNHDAQLAAIALDIQAGRAPETTGENARATIELLSAIYKSSLTGEPVRKGTITPGDPFYTAFHGGHKITHRPA